MRSIIINPLTLILVLLMAGCSTQKKETPEMHALQAKIRRFAPTIITADTSRLAEGDRRALHVLVEATRLIDTLYIRQVWSGNEALRNRLASDRTPEGLLRFEYFTINMGPWSKLDHDEPFIPGVPPKPMGANYYPDGMSKTEFNDWLSPQPEADRKKATGFFTTIRPAPNGGYAAVPYSEEYKDLLVPAAGLLKQAAASTANASLQSFLIKRADAFLSNDYYESDLAWMDLDSPIEPTIGPYEVYMDELFNYKAAFEAFITIRNDEETSKLAKYSGYLQDIEDHLPIAPRYRNPKLGALAPIRVVDEVAIGGEARAGVQTAAYNLPNDERVVSEKGSKRVMLRNVQEAKFKTVLSPIADLAIDSLQQPLIKFEPFFTHILMHELMHGLGPHSIIVKGKASTVRQELKELYSALEEAKADISGLFALQYLIDKGVIDKPMEQSMYVTYLAGVFRTLRFGISDAHARGMALQYNYLADEGAFAYDSTRGTFKVNFDRMKDGVRKLTGEIMTVQAEGDYQRAENLLNRFSALRPEMTRTIEKLSSIPVDIAPRFPLAGDAVDLSTN